MDYSVAVIGGGLLGASFGWGLARRKIKTIVIDQGDNAIRTARGNFGLVWLQSKGVGMPEYARWTHQSTHDWGPFSEELEATTGIGIHYDRCGGYILCLDDAMQEATERSMSTLMTSLGDHAYDCKSLSYVEVKQALPLVGKIAGATYSPHDGHCNPLNLLRALHKGFIMMGGRYHSNCTISTITPLTGGGFRVTDESTATTFSAEKIIIAAGHGSAQLGSQVGLDIPIFPDQGQVLVTEKRGPVLRHPTNFVRQTDDGSFMLGPSSQKVGFNTDTNLEVLAEIARNCCTAFPFLSQIKIQRAWAALRIMTPDGFPVYQQSDEHSGAFSFACHSGVTLASTHALQVPKWIEQGAIPKQYEAFHPRRFHV